MEVKRYDMIVVGAGPAGLSAAIEAAKHGVKPRSEDSRSARSFLPKPRNTVLKLF